MGGAQQYFGVIPDLATIGKAMANGYAISALVGKKEIMNVLADKVFRVYFKYLIENYMSEFCFSRHTQYFHSVFVLFNLKYVFHYFLFMIMSPTPEPALISSSILSAFVP